MNLSDAINEINQFPEQTMELVECLRSNRTEAVRLLLSELDSIVNTVVSGQEPHNKNMNIILGLITEFRVSEAFVKLKLILSNHLVPHFDFKLIAGCVCMCVTETDMATLKDYIMQASYSCETRLVAYMAIRNLISQRASDNLGFHQEELINFIIEIIDIYPSLDRFSNHNLLRCLFDECYRIGSNKVVTRMADLLKQLIINDESGFHFSGFKDYYEWLYRIDPILPNIIKNIKIFTHQYNKQVDNDVFCLDSLQLVGKHIFIKAVGTVESATTEIVKLAVKQMHHYPYNERSEPVSDEDYYLEISIDAGFFHAPKLLLKDAQELFDFKYQAGIKKTASAIINRKDVVKAEVNMLMVDYDKLIGKRSKENNLNLDITPIINKIDMISIKKKQFEAEIELLSFYEKQLIEIQKLFCEDYSDEATVTSELKALSFNFASRESGNKQIADHFDMLRKKIDQVFTLIGTDANSDSLDRILDKIIFLPFLKQLEKEALSTGTDPNAYKELVFSHPLCSSNLSKSRKEAQVYINILDKHSGEAIKNIRYILDNSIALSERKEILGKCITLFCDNEYEMFINILPIQIEGLFADLHRALPFELFKDMNLYSNLVLRQKIDALSKKGVNKFFEIEAYFKYYFNSTIRNTVAHGKYKLLVSTGEDYQRLALELLLALNYFMDAIFSVNELDAMNEYISSTAHQFNDDKSARSCESFYDGLFSDLNGTRTRLWVSDYKSGLFKTYDPTQILFWIFNPFYEAHCIHLNSLNTMRKVLQSSDFWKFVLAKLDAEHYSPRFEKKTFIKVVSTMLSLKSENDQRKILIDIIKTVNQVL